jgi:hypothetical protein
MFLSLPSTKVLILSQRIFIFLSFSLALKLMSSPFIRQICNSGCLCSNQYHHEFLGNPFWNGMGQFESLLPPSIWIIIMLRKPHILLYSKPMQQ